MIYICIGVYEISIHGFHIYNYILYIISYMLCMHTVYIFLVRLRTSLFIGVHKEKWHLYFRLFLIVKQRGKWHNISIMRIHFTVGFAQFTKPRGQPAERTVICVPVQGLPSPPLAFPREPSGPSALTGGQLGVSLWHMVRLKGAHPLSIQELL